MGTIGRLIRRETGISAIWTAISAFFLIGAAALAVDVSGFYREARFEQTAADMTCLAGVRDLPQSPVNALNNAVGVAKNNWKKFAGYSPTITGNQAVLSDGNGNSVTIVAAYNGEPTKMAVTVTQAAPTKFGKVLGANSAQVTQEAYCKVQGQQLGDLPFGSLPGGFDGVLQNDNPCDTGNCRPVDLPRSDISGSGNWFIRNVAIGAQASLKPDKTTANPAMLTTCTVGSGPCTIVNQNQGVSSGQLSDGLVRGGAGVPGRLANPTPDANFFFSIAGRKLNGDSVEDVLDADTSSNPDVMELASAALTPAKWDADVHGDMAAVLSGPNGSKHLYYDGTIKKCSSPRIARIPIIAQTTWVAGQPVVLPGGNSDPVKVVGFYLVILEDPNDTLDFKNPSDALKTASAKAIWLGPTANCAGTGGNVKPYEEGDAKVLRLVDKNG